MVYHGDDASETFNMYCSTGVSHMKIELEGPAIHKELWMVMQSEAAYAGAIIMQMTFSIKLLMVRKN